MQQAVPEGEGAMAAVMGLEAEAVEALCAEAAQGQVVSPANFNGAGQVVVAGHAGAVARLTALAAERRARARLLPVSAPFHCALMRPAADAMEHALAGVTMNAPSKPVIVNVTARPTSDVEAIRNHLVEQVTGMVRWTESIGWAAGEGGVGELYELGTGKVLTGLAKRIAPDAQATAINTPADIDAVVAALG